MCRVTQHLAQQTAFTQGYYPTSKLVITNARRLTTNLVAPTPWAFLLCLYLDVKKAFLRREIGVLARSSGHCALLAERHSTALAHARPGRKQQRGLGTCPARDGWSEPTFDGLKCGRLLLSRMDLARHHSNPSRSLEALLEGCSDGCTGPRDGGGNAAERNAEAGRRPIASEHRRHDWVLDAVICVLIEHRESMRARDIHNAVEALLGESVRPGSVKQCLSSNVIGSSARFVRVARGWYAISVVATNSAASPPKQP